MPLQGSQTCFQLSGAFEKFAEDIFISWLSLSTVNSCCHKTVGVAVGIWGVAQGDGKSRGLSMGGEGKLGGSVVWGGGVAWIHML